MPPSKLNREIADVLSDPLDRKILAAIALCAQAIERATWASLLELGAPGQRRVVSATELGKKVAAWLGAGLIVERGREHYELVPALRHEVLLGMRAAGELDAWHLRSVEVLTPKAAGSYWQPPGLHLSAARTHLYLGREGELRGALAAYAQASARLYHQPTPPLWELLGRDAPFAALALLPSDLAEEYLLLAVDQALFNLHALAPAAFALSERDTLGKEVLSRVALCALFAARVDAAEPLLARLQGLSPEETAARAMSALTQGDARTARDLARRAFELVPGTQRARVRMLLEPVAPWLCLLLVSSSEPGLVQLGLDWVRLAEPARNRVPHNYAFLLLEQFRRELDANRELELHPSLFMGAEGVSGLWLEQAFGWLCLAWSSADETPKARRNITPIVQRAERQGMLWLADALRTPSATGRLPRHALLNLYQRRPIWENTLSTLERLLEGAADAAGVGKQAGERLVWEVAIEPKPALYARLQAQTKTGFSRGKRISLKRLASARDKAESWIGEADRAVLRHLVREREYGGERFTLELAALTSLCGHPRVCLDSNPGRFVNVIRRPPRLLVKDEASHEGGLRLSLAPERCATEPLVLEAEGDDTLVVYELDPALLDVARTLARGVSLPRAAEQRLASLIGKLSAKFEVLSDLAGTGVLEVAADERMHVRLWRATSGVRGRVVVQPLPGVERWYHPGRGLTTIVFDSGGQSRQTHRNLSAEAAREAALLEACPALARAEHNGEDFTLRELVPSLELLLELRALGDDVVVHWPEGAPLSVGAERKTRDVRLRVGSAQDLLTFEGELEISPELTLQMSDLLAAAQKAQGRFLPLGDDQFVALEHNLLRRLTELAAVSTSKGKRTQVNSALAPLVESWLAESEHAKLSGAAEQLLERVREARVLEPELPPGLDVQLRPYQQAGYAWLCRLAHWGGGACLSDDMGLGKTLQVLALLLRRAPAGPALVVAPTSVCQGWLKEAQRFAPRLNLRRFGTGDRGAQLDGLGPFDVLVSSYGVMQNEIDALEQVEFQTIVLDEAQAIKNLSAQRTQAACRLNGRFRVATTGTPIENHLGEIWSILNFTNPGLLGTHKRFEERFARPISLDHDRQAAELLRQLVAPFLLRRTKGEVLSELPAKTEITLHVELGLEERALYETIRQKALRTLDTRAPKGQQHLKVLAELMRLRRAACHPELVAPGSGLESAKLNALRALVEELREGGHRALVFSQFVDHLNLVRAWLKEAGISHQYLVGATPEKERVRAIEAFQQGQGDLFLISLKAGGFGLNLTQADYVVILDPWWNPAAEDQAADRAHRIGQHRPVTVYRLVARDTVEERIVALHQHKRNLADSLLEGMSEAAPLDLEALRELMLVPGDRQADA